MNFMFLLQHEISATGEILSMGQGVTLIDDSRRGLRASHGARGGRHSIDSAAIRHVAANSLRQNSPVQCLIQNHLGGSPLLQGLSIATLMIEERIRTREHNL